MYDVVGHCALGVNVSEGGVGFGTVVPIYEQVLDDESYSKSVPHTGE
jgi:hypothetical protein